MFVSLVDYVLAVLSSDFPGEAEAFEQQVESHITLTRSFHIQPTPTIGLTEPYPWAWSEAVAEVAAHRLLARIEGEPAFLSN